MSVCTWKNDGYGICISDLKEEIQLSRLMKLIETAPKLYKNIKTYESECCGGQIIENYDILVSYVEEFGEMNYGGLASILYEVIKEAEGIELIVSTDFNDKVYLIYAPAYPWELSDKEQNLTEDTLTEIYSKYLHIVTDESLTVKYHYVEGCS